MTDEKVPDSVSGPYGNRTHIDSSDSRILQPSKRSNHLTRPAPIFHNGILSIYS